MVAVYQALQYIMIVKLITKQAKHKNISLLSITSSSFRFSSLNAKIDYFQVLGVSSRASEDEVKSAYHAKAKQYHPDVNPQLEDQFKLVNEAYRILSDANLKRQYIKIHQSIDRQEIQSSVQKEIQQQDKSSSDPFNDMFKTHVKYFQMLKKQRTNSHISRDQRSQISKNISNKKKNQRTSRSYKYLLASFGFIWLVLIGQMFIGFTRQKKMSVVFTVQK